jgi:hypothetical protein
MQDILFQIKKEGTTDILNNLDESQQTHAQLKKKDSKDCLL